MNSLAAVDKILLITRRKTLEASRLVLLFGLSFLLASVVVYDPQAGL